LILPRGTWIRPAAEIQRSRTVTQPGALMSSTGDPSGEPRLGATRAGDVLAHARRGAQGRPGHAPGRLHGSAGFVPRAATVNVPAGVPPTSDADATEPVVLDCSVALTPSAHAPADGGHRLAEPAATAGGPGHGWPATTISGRQPGGLEGGRGRLAAPELRTRHRSKARVCPFRSVS
jgi:hypothetical protein